MSQAPAGFDPDIWRTWDEKSQKAVLESIENAKKTKRFWYCKRGRTCDGMPHEGMDYPHARGDQWPPEGTDWFTWLILSGRGSGKTRSAAEWVRNVSRKVERIAMIGRRGPDVRGTMVEGDSGLIAVCERAGIGYTWYPSRKEFHFANGAVAYGYSGEEPDTLRGPQHGAAWLDEPAHMPLIEDVWDNLLFGLRLPGLPGGAKVMCTSTPLPRKWIKNLKAKDSTVTVTVSTHANLHNLDPQYRANIIEKYEGTRLGEQELHGKILEDVEGALWKMWMIEPYRNIERFPNGQLNEDYVSAEMMDRIVVGVDPAGSSAKNRDETGIVVVGKRGDHYYVFADYSGHYTPNGWARAAWKAYDRFNADKIVAEKNYGGEMVLSTLRNERPDGNAKLVNSRRGKVLRAEPIVGLYEQKRVHHSGDLQVAEEQMTEWVPVEGKDSPDRVDALVHAMTELSGKGGPAQIAIPGRKEKAETNNDGYSTRRGAFDRSVLGNSGFGQSIPGSGLLDHRGNPISVQW